MIGEICTIEDPPITKQKNVPIIVPAVYWGLSSKRSSLPYQNPRPYTDKKIAFTTAKENDTWNVNLNVFNWPLSNALVKKAY